MDLSGVLTGIRVLEYWESLRGSRGDFLAAAGFQDQFRGKDVADPFRVGRDVDGISGATITVDAMSSGIRSAARRVAEAYLARSSPRTSDQPTFVASIGLAELSRLSWIGMLDRGLARRVVFLERGLARMEVSMMYLRDRAVGELMLGSGPFQSAVDRAGSRADEDRLLMLGIEGSGVDVFGGQTLFLVQERDTIWVSRDNVVMVGAAIGGKIEGQFGQVGILLVGPDFDVTRSFAIVLEPGRAFPAVNGRRPNLGVFTAQYLTQREDESVIAPSVGVDGSTASSESVGDTVVVAGQLPSSAGGAAVVEDVSEEALAASFAYIEEEETLLARVLERTSWARVFLLLLLLSLATTAFFTKNELLRWVTLGATLVYLGAIDGGFLSVSHIISGISVGPGVYLNDLPLLLIVTFTVVTTLVWGRVFCGFLCPFGALQDFLGRVVPVRFRRSLPRSLHEHALLTKYVVLLVVLIPAIIGSHISLFAYFEPFGTVFFPQPLGGLVGHRDIDPRSVRHRAPLLLPVRMPSRRGSGHRLRYRPVADPTS
jgi:NosR/NirI family transcriptional regulator, nitrous oxide reductase regulator